MCPEYDLLSAHVPPCFAKAMTRWELLSHESVLSASPGSAGVQTWLRRKLEKDIKSGVCLWGNMTGA